jgi:hypothetical protein
MHGSGGTDPVRLDPGPQWANHSMAAVYERVNVTLSEEYPAPEPVLRANSFQMGNNTPGTVRSADSNLETRFASVCAN